MLNSNKFKEKEATMKYIFSQAVPSRIVLATAIITGPNSTITVTIIFFAITIKLGIAPTHFWLPSVISGIPWRICWILATIQKITPLLLILQITHLNPLLFTMRAILSAIIGGIGGFNQTQLRPIIAYSSISHIGWITAASLYSTTAALIYMTSYILITSSLFGPLHIISATITNINIPLTTTPTLPWLTTYSLIRLGGMPPTFGFFPKLIVLIILSQNYNLLLALTLITGTLINLYYYLNILLSLIMQTPFKAHIKRPDNLSNITLLWAISTTIGSLTGIIIVPILFIS